MVGLVAMTALLLAGAVVALVGDGSGERQARQDLSRSSAEAAGSGGSGGATGFAAGSSALTASGGGGSGGAPAPAPPVAPDAFEAQAAAVGQVPDAPDTVVKTADLRLEIKRGTFVTAFDAATRLAGQLGGFVASSDSHTRDDRLASGSLVLRVPAVRFDEARAQLSELGTVEGQEVSGQEVGTQLVDLGARLTSLRAQEEALRGLMTRARTVGETLQVQEQLGVVRQQIEQLAAQQAQLQDAVGMATIHVRLTEPGAAVTRPAEEPSGLGHAVERALDGAEAVLAGTIVVVGYAVPLGLLALLGWLGVRLGLARRRRAAPVSAA
jgi:hypothetical protein